MKSDNRSREFLDPGFCRGDGSKPDKVIGKYQELFHVLDEAYDQAAKGKGKERHAGEETFEDQPIMWIEKHFKSFQLGQAVKKLHESQGLPVDQAVRELLGAINYIAVRVIFLRNNQ